MTSLVQDTADFLRFLKSRFHLYHCSNVFFRDFQYGIMAYAEEKGTHVSYGNAEELAQEIIVRLTAAGILKGINPGTWMLNYVPFRTPSTKSEAAPKVNAAAAPAKPAAAWTT
jgi:hypothetical protein